MIDIFSYGFMIRAFIAGSVIGILAPFIGTFLVARRYSLIADSLSHVALAGVAIGIITGIYPVYAALGVTVVAALLIEQLRRNARLSGESALAIFLSGGLAIAITLIGLANGFSVDLFLYLFGSITTVQQADVYVVGALGVVVCAILTMLYKEFFFASFDEEVAFVYGVPTRALQSVLMIMTAVTVALSMRIVGALLVGALMVIPVVAAMQIAKSFKATILYAIGIGIISIWAGLFAAYYLDIPSGGAIVLSSLGILGIATLLRR
jgi:zinc transport system permease protein